MQLLHVIWLRLIGSPNEGQPWASLKSRHGSATSLIQTSSLFICWSEELLCFFVKQLFHKQLTISVFNVYEAFRGSVSCPRTHWHADGEDWGLNCQPFGWRTTTLTWTLSFILSISVRWRFSRCTVCARVNPQDGGTLTLRHCHTLVHLPLLR